MQVLVLDPLPTLVVDVIAWLMLHLGIGSLCSKIPVERFDPDRRFYQSAPFEKEGRIYQELFRVRSWKRFIPQGSKLYGDTFSLQQLSALDPAYLERWIRESIRAEFCHWMMIFPSVFFFLWNSLAMAWAMVVYAVVNNFFPIVVQRFNRPRVRRLLALATADRLPPGLSAEPERTQANLTESSVSRG